MMAETSTRIWFRKGTRGTTYVVRVMCVSASLAFFGARDAAGVPSGSCLLRTDLCVHLTDPSHVRVWDHNVWQSEGDGSGSFDNNLEVTAEALMHTTEHDILRVRIEDKNLDVTMALFSPGDNIDVLAYPSDPGCGGDALPDAHVVLCNIRADSVGKFHISVNLGAGDDRLKFSVEPAARDALSRIQTELRGGIDNDSIISDATADDVDLGLGDEYGDLGGLPPGNSTAHDVGDTGGGYDTLYCDTSYRTATPTRDPFNPSSWGPDELGRPDAGCTLIGGSAAGYSWLFGANTDDDLLVGDAGGYAYDPAGSNRLYCGDPGPTTDGSSGPSPNLGAHDLLCTGISGITTIEDLVAAVSMLSGASDSAPYPPSGRTTNYDATVIDAVIQAVDAALVGSP